MSDAGLLARILLPQDDALLPLHLGDGAAALPAGVRRSGARGIELDAGVELSLFGYFTAFPAWQWARSTVLERVVLRVAVEGEGLVRVVRTDSAGRARREEHPVATGETEVVLELAEHADGGWIGIELAAGRAGLRLVEASWRAVDGDERPVRTTSLAITTVNRVDYLREVIATLGTDAEALEVIDRIRVIDQGSDHVDDRPDFAPLAAALGGRLEIIRQANLGGSGGYSRGMLETLEAGESGSVLLLDDDIRVDPQSVRRAVMFSSYATTPTIVGGHMLDINQPTVLHSGAEQVESVDFMWRSLTPSRHDFAATPLPAAAWAHQAWQPNYNGWWMCLIPVEALRAVGLSMPYFIKWDDSEFGLRAGAAGFPTVSLFGGAVWHVAWVDKDDSLDWQSFYHARNRLLAALVHSPRRGGRLWLSNLAVDLRFAITMDYYAVELRHAAYRSALADPATLEHELDTRLPALRALAAEHIEARLVPDAEAPTARPLDLPEIPSAPSGARGAAVFAARILRNALVPVRAGELRSTTAKQARWWIVSGHDRLLSRAASGSGWIRRERDPRTFRRLLRRSIALNLRYRRQWDRLARDWRAAAARQAEPATWRALIAEADARR